MQEKGKSLVEILREEGQDSQKRVVTGESSRNEGAAKREEDLARTIIQDLPTRLKKAARDGETTLDVMELDDFRSRHYDQGRFPTKESLKSFVEIEGLSPEILNGAAKSVYGWLLGQEGLSVDMRIRHNSDESCGRAWSTAYLVVSW